MVLVVPLLLVATVSSGPPIGSTPNAHSLWVAHADAAPSDSFSVSTAGSGTTRLSGRAPTDPVSDSNRGHVAPLAALPYGVRIVSAGTTYAGLVPAIDFGSGSGDRNCSSPSANVSRPTAELLSPTSPSLLCLNGVRSGVVSATWEANLTNDTTYQNGTTSIHGCPPLPNQTGCEFYASNRYTANLSEWVDGSPTNSTTMWQPGENGFAPTDAVFYLEVAFNDSAVPGGLYPLTVDLNGAMPVPTTFYVRTPAGGVAANVTIVFDLSLAWLTLVPTPPPESTLIPEIVPDIGGYRLGSVAPPCALCAVVFAETGLPTETAWDVQVTGVETIRSTSSVAREQLANGTYAYTVGCGNSSWAAARGDLTVQGSAVNVPIAFRLVTYLVAFSEVGLPTATNWSVTLRGIAEYARASTLSVPEPNGSYVYDVGAVPGYSVNRSGGLVELNGGEALVPLRFSPTAAKPTVLGLPAAEAYALLLGGAALGAAGVLGAVLLRRKRMPPDGASPPVHAAPGPPPPSR